MKPAKPTLVQGLRNRLAPVVVVILTYVLAAWCCAIELLTNLLDRKTPENRRKAWFHSNLLAECDRISEHRWAVLTGADGVIGNAVGQILLRLGFNLITIGLKSPKFGTCYGNRVISLNADLNDVISVRQCVQKLTHLDVVHVDLLIACAGVMLAPEPTSPSELDPHISVNVVGHAALFDAFKPFLKNSPHKAKAVFVSSSTCRLGDLKKILVYNEPQFRQYVNGYKSYADSKLLLNLYAKSLARKLQESESPIQVVSVHPGVVSSPLYSQVMQPFRFIIIHILKFLLRSPERAAIEILDLAFDDSAQPGSYYEYNHEPAFMDNYTVNELNKVYRIVQKELL